MSDVKGCPICAVTKNYEICCWHEASVEYMQANALRRIADSLEQLNITLTRGVNNAAVEAEVKDD